MGDTGDGRPPAGNPWAVTTDDRLREHMRRKLGRTAPQDASERYRVTVLQELLRVTEMALRDEEVPPGVAGRVLDRIIYGCTPHDADRLERQVMREDAVRLMESQPSRMLLTDEQWEDLHRRFREPT